MCGLAACSNTEDAIVEAPYVTNAEYVLDRIDLDAKSGVAFQVKPIRTTACKHMYIEIGQQDANGQWRRTNAMYPGKDNRNDFGQKDLKDQIHFAEVDNVGEYGVIALGCEPYNGQMSAVRSLLATFEVEPGKLNYIGEIALIPTGSRGFSTVEVADRTDFALEQIQLQLPALESYFHASPMEKYVVEISPEQQAALDRIAETRKKIHKEVADRNRIIDARNRLFDELTKAQEVLATWDAKNGYPQQPQSKKQAADRMIYLSAVGRINGKVRRYDKWLRDDIDFALTEKYMKLEAVADRARRAKDAKYPRALGEKISEERMNDPEFKKLSDAAWNADVALREFAKRHKM